MSIFIHHIIIICALLIPFAAAADIKHENICAIEETKENPLCRAVGSSVYLKNPDGSLEYWFKVVGIAKLNKGDAIYQGRVARTEEYYFICKVDSDNKEYFLKPVSAENIIVLPYSDKT